MGVNHAAVSCFLTLAAGPYFWASVLGGAEWGPFFAWVTGYFNLLGQVAVTAAIEYVSSPQQLSLASLTRPDQ